MSSLAAATGLGRTIPGPTAGRLSIADKFSRVFYTRPSNNREIPRPCSAPARRYSFGIRPRPGGALVLGGAHLLSRHPRSDLHRLAHWLWRHRLRWLARFVAHLSRFFTGIEIHPGPPSAAASSSTTAWAWSSARRRLIGDDVTLYHGVTLGGTSWNKGKRHPTLENGVVIGAGAKVLGRSRSAPGPRSVPTRW